MEEEKVDKNRIEGVNEGCVEEKKTVRKNRLIKTAKTSTKVVAVFIVGMFLLNNFVALAENSEYSVEIDVADLPYEHDICTEGLQPVADGQIKIRLFNAPENTALLINISGASPSTLFCVDGVDVGSIESGIANLFIITITDSSVLSFTPVGGHIAITKIESSVITAPVESKICGRTFYQVAHGEHMFWNYAAEIQLPQENNLSVNITFAEDDLTYLTITNGSISKFGVCPKLNNNEYMNISIYDHTEVFRLMSKEPVKFTLYVVDPVEEEVISDMLILNISKTQFKDIMVEKTFSLNTQNDGNILKTILQELEKTQKKVEQSKYTQAEEWLNDAIDDLVILYNGVDERHIGMNYQTQMIIEYLNGVGNITADTKDMVLHRVNKSMDYLSYMFLYIHEPAIRVKPVREKLENAKEILEKKNTGSLDDVINDLNTALFLLDYSYLDEDEENNIMLQQPIFILYWLEMTKENLDSIVENEDINGVNGAINLLENVIEDLQEVINTSTSEEEITAIVEELKNIDYNNPQPSLEGVLNMLENLLEHLDDSDASINRLEKIEERLENMEEDYEDGDINTSVLQEEINETVDELNVILTTINGVPLRFDAITGYDLIDDDNDSVPLVNIYYSDVWLKYQPYPIFVTVDGSRNTCISDSYEVEYIECCVGTIGDVDDNDPSMPVVQPETIPVGEVTYNVKYLKNVATGFPVIQMSIRNITLVQTASYTLIEEDGGTDTVSVVSPFSSKVTDLDQDGISNGVEYNLKSSLIDSDSGPGYDGVYPYAGFRDKDYKDNINITRTLTAPPVLQDVCEASAVFLSTFDAEVTFGIDTVGGTYELLNDGTLSGGNEEYNTSYGIYSFILVTYTIVDIENASLLENALNIRLGNKTVNYTCSESFAEGTSNFSGQMVNYTFTETLAPGSYNITVTLDRNTFLNTSSLTIIPKKIVVNKNCTYVEEDVDEDGDGLLIDQEKENGTSPSNRDTDNDYFWDGAEIDFWNLTYGLPKNSNGEKHWMLRENVTNSSDFDNDGMLDGYEIMFYTNITNPDSDNDGLSDFDEVFQYFNVQKLEAEGDGCYSSGNKTDDGVRITSDDESSVQAEFMYEIPEGGNYRIKAVGSSQINANKTETNINMSIQMIQEKGYSYEEGYRALPNEYLSRGTDKILKENMQITTSGQVTTGNTLLTMNEPEKLGDLTEVDMTQGRYISLYANVEKGMQTIDYTLVSSQETSTMLDIDYISVERQGLDPWDPDTDKDGVMDGDEVIKYGTSPWVGDTDGDGIWDSEETCVFRLPQIDEDFSFSLSSPQGSTQLYIPLLGNSTPVRVNHASITINALPGTNYKEITEGYAMEPSIDYKVVDSEGVIHVVWSDDTSGKFQIYYRNSSDNGVTWNSVVGVSDSREDCIQPDIAVDQSGNVHIVWKEVKPESLGLASPWKYWWFYRYQDNTYLLASDGINVKQDSGYKISKNGKDYELTSINTDLISEVIQNGDRFRWQWLPGSNKIMYANLSNPDNVQQIDYASSQAIAYPHIVATNNYLHIIFSKAYVPHIGEPTPAIFPLGYIKYTRSSDSGYSWENLKTIGFTDAGGPNPTTLADSNGNLYAAWESNPFKDETEIKFASSNNDGVDWNDEQVVVASGFGPFDPCLATGGGCIYLAFATDRPYGAHRIYYKKSTNNGIDWSQSCQITDSLPLGDCSNPKIDVDDSFNLHIVWQDSRGGKYRIYYKMLSKDNVLLVDETPISFNDSVNPSIVSNSAVHVVWQSILSVSPKSETSKICYMAYDRSVVPTNVRVYVGDTSNEVFKLWGDFCSMETIDVTNEVREHVFSHLNEYLATNNILSEEVIRHLSESNYTSSYSMNVPIIVKADDGQLNLKVDLNIGGSQFYMTHTGNDEDEDGLSDVVELGYIGDSDPSIVTDPMNSDSDNDGIPDNEEDKDGNGEVEVGVETDPLNPDTDFDGIPDRWEMEHELDPLLYEKNIDYDGDGLTNIQEYNLETEPKNGDTDSDGLSDSDELIDVLFRTNIKDGAVAVDGYKQLDDNAWVYYKDKTWSAGSTYVYSHMMFDAANKTEGWYGNECNQLVLTLKDGTEIYLNTTYNEIIYVWESKWTENRSYYQFNISDLSVETSSLPVPGYKNQEIFYGPNPLVNDTDRDGVLDGDEYDWSNDYDNDGIINALDRDSDNDGLTDYQEYFGGNWWSGKNNQDNDEWPNMVDSDSDNDGISDALELLPLSDIDNDTLPNFIDNDSDGDGLLDGEEDANYNGTIDENETSPIRADTDNDGLSDYDEIFIHNTTPTRADTDFDGLNDGDEIGLVETDGYPNTYLTSPVNPDTDNDTLLDGEEVKGWYIMVEQGDEEHLTHVTSNPLLVDSDNDGLLDSEEIYNAVYWVSEAENYRTNDTQLVDNNKAITNKTDSDEIYNVTLSVPNGTYQYYVRAKIFTPFYYGNFETGDDTWGGAQANTGFERTSVTSYRGDYSMRVYATGTNSALSIDINPSGWDIDDYSVVTFAYKIPSGVPIGLFFYVDGYGWICLGGTSTHNHGSYSYNDVYTLVDDNTWHTITINAKDSIREFWSSADIVTEFEWYTSSNAADGNEFWFDEFKVLGGGLELQTSNGLSETLQIISDEYQWYSTGSFQTSDSNLTLFAYDVSPMKQSVCVDKILLAKNGLFDDMESNEWIFSDGGGYSVRIADYSAGAYVSASRSIKLHVDDGGTNGTDHGWVAAERMFDPFTTLTFKYNITEMNGEAETGGASYYWESMGQYEICIEAFNSKDNSLGEYWYVLGWINTEEDIPHWIHENCTIIQQSPPLNSWLTFNRNISSDWNTLDWSEVSKMKITLRVISSWTHSDSYTIYFDDAIILSSDATNPLNQDTDYDGLWDGDEIQWFEKDGIPNTYPSDPADSDTENDGLSDGQEVIGWNVSVEELVSVKYIKITGTYNSVNNGFHVVELEAYSSGVNVALASNGATITGTNGGSWNNVIDGDTINYDGYNGYGYTYWNTAPPGSMTITLAYVCKVDMVRVLLWDGHGTSTRYYHYKIEVSEDGNNWILVVNKTAGYWRSWQNDTVAASNNIIMHVTSDPREIDTDGDGIDDRMEYQYTNASSVDTDNDVLSDYDELYAVGAGLYIPTYAEWYECNDLTGNVVNASGYLEVTGGSSGSTSAYYNFTTPIPISRYRFLSFDVEKVSGSTSCYYLSLLMDTSPSPDSYQFVTLRNTGHIILTIPDDFPQIYNNVPITEYNKIAFYSSSGATYRFRNIHLYTSSDPTNCDSDYDKVDDGAEVNVYATEPMLFDTDNDGLPDNYEIGSPVLDPLDPSDANKDSDNDGLTAGEEYKIGTSDSDPDYDNDDLPDGWEAKYNLDPIVTNDGNGDADGDGLTNLMEYQYHMPDGWSGIWWGGLDPTTDDTDGDGMPDKYEYYISCLDGTVNDASWDYDNDGLSNYEEYVLETNPDDVDSDRDDMPDGWEVGFGLNPLDDGSSRWVRTFTGSGYSWDADGSGSVVNGGSGDKDNDGLNNLDEFNNNLDPTNPDCDNDGMWDGYEVDYGLNPLVNDADEDPDNDELSNLEEYNLQLYPDNWDSDGDDMPDGYEVRYGLSHTTNDASGDKDKDGLFNLDEFKYNIEENLGVPSFDYYKDNFASYGVYWNGLNPLNPDCDMDGVSDGQEINGFYGFNYKYESIGLIYTDPLNPDCDNDGVTDGMEKNGWSVPVMYYGLSEPSIVTLYGDPTDDESNIMDTDGDGMSDRYEIEHMSEDSDQYNPFIRENIPPRVESIKTWIEIDKKTIDLKCAGITFFSISVVESIWIKTEVKVYDASGISSLKLELYMKGGAQPYLHTWWEGWTPHAEIRWKTVQTDIGSKTWTNMGSGIHTKTFSCSVDGLTFALSSFIGYFVDVDATDLCGNSVSVEYKKDGFYDIALTYLEQAGNWLYEQLIDGITWAYNWAVNMKNKIDGWVEKVLNDFGQVALGGLCWWDWDHDGLGYLLERQLGTNWNEKDLFLEVDWMKGFEPSTDWNFDPNSDSWDPKNDVFDYFIKYYDDRGINVHILKGEEVTHKEYVNSDDVNNIENNHHQNWGYAVYVLFADNGTGDLSKSEIGEGVAGKNFGAVIFKGHIKSFIKNLVEPWSEYAWTTIANCEKRTIMHEVGHCIGILWTDKGKTIDWGAKEIYCDNDNGFHSGDKSCVMARGSSIDSDNNPYTGEVGSGNVCDNPIYCNKHWDLISNGWGTYAGWWLFSVGALWHSM